MKQVALAVCLTIPLSFPSIAGSISTQMDNAFNSMVNTTTPKAYNTARRGVLSGGGVFVRNDIKRTNLVSMTPPSFSAGCGGIDLHGGSFSYINADQFIQTFQAIGSNAVGYGVKLALQSACPTCENIMTSLQKTAEFMNKMNVDSCQAAQGLVNAGVQLSAGLNADNIAKTASVASGGFSDISEAMNFLNTDGKTAASKFKSDNPTQYKEAITKNIAWGAFVQNNVKSAYPSGDNTLLELFMSITGSVIVKDEGGNDEPVRTIKLAGHQVSLEDLMADTSSNPIKIYQCNNYDKDGCLNVNPTPQKSFTDKGMKKRIFDAMAGSNGIIQAYINDAEWSTEAKQALSLSSINSQMCLTKIYEAMSNSKDNEAAALSIADACSARMSLEITYSMVIGFIRSVETMIKNPDPKFKNTAAIEEMQVVLTESRQRYMEEYSVLSEKYSVNNIMKIIENAQFTSGDARGMARR